jgi:arylsulfatase B
MRVLLLSAVCLAWERAVAKPHVFLIAIDDVGWADHEMYGKSDVPTPHLRAMAGEGIPLTGYYTQPVCSPTRTSFLTGMFPFRVGLQHTTTLLPGGTAAVPLDQPMLPELLSPLGYRTHHIGKWHLGYARWANTPRGRGFEHSLGYLQGQEDYFTKTLGAGKIKGVAGADFWDSYDRADEEYSGNHSLPQYMERFEHMLAAYNKTHPSARDKVVNPYVLVGSSARARASLH